MTIARFIRRLPLASRRGLALGIVVASVAVLATVVAPTATPAHADEGSALTVSWANDTSSAKALQPDRTRTALSPAPTTPGQITNPHYDDFKNLKVAVSKTKGLGDEVVRIDISGMRGGTVGQKDMPGAGSQFSSVRPTFQQNYFHVMQCWGDPASDKFRETCLWGAITSADGVVQDNTGRYEVPFRSVQNKSYADNPYENPNKLALMSEITGPTTTNEIIAAPVKADGTSTFGFQVFTSAQAPWMGCGAPLPSGSPRECSLVIVPRGTVHGGVVPVGSYRAAPATYGAKSAQSVGPFSPKADVWDNRIVVPLRFADARTSCAGDRDARLVGGSPMPGLAVESWRTALCAEKGLAFSYASNADARSREQLVQGDLGVVYTTRPVIDAEVDEGTREQAAESDIVYAPATVSGITIGFRISGGRGERTDLRLSPRLIAKLLTQSYQGALPNFDTSVTLARHVEKNPASLPTDPEFISLNPTLDQYQDGLGNLSNMVLAGPSGSDGIRLLWEYLRADDKARAFLTGQPDNVLQGDGANTGMRINPYYLPYGHPDGVVPEFVDVDQAYDDRTRGKLLKYATDAQGKPVMRRVGLTGPDGGPLNLATDNVDTFALADQTPVPAAIKLTGNAIPTTRIDSVGFNPYAETLEAAARRVFRGESRRPYWDTGKIVPGVDVTGGWSAQAPQLPGAMRVLGTTDTASAAGYQLATAQLQLPNRPEVFVAPTSDSLTAAMSAQKPLGEHGTTWPDLSKLSPTAYPLTLVSYAAVNLPLTEADERADYADLITYGVVDGQTLGEGIGQLPAGYAPMPGPLRRQALGVAQQIRDYVPPPLEQSEDVEEVASEPSITTTIVAPPASTTTTTAVDAAGQTATGYDTEAAATVSDTSPIGASGAVGGALVAAILGLLASPFLLRRRVVS